MKVPYQRISKSWVALHPEPKGVVEFYGGQLFGQFPIVSYDYFLEQIYNAGYSIIAVPFQFGLNHAEIAYTLLAERNTVLNTVPELNSLPLFWVGHSVGCKYIALLEAYTDSKTNAFKLETTATKGAEVKGILDEPSLLIAPDISDTGDTIPIPLLPSVLDMFNLGVRPSRSEIQKLIQESDLFNLTAIISFQDDDVAGSVNGSPETSDVAWFYETLSNKSSNQFFHKELEGDHLEPLGVEIGKTVFDITSIFDLVQDVPRQLEPTALDFLSKLSSFLSPGSKKQVTKTIEPPKPVEPVKITPEPKVEAKAPVEPQKPAIAPTPQKIETPKKETPKPEPVSAEPKQPTTPKPAPVTPTKPEQASTTQIASEKKEAAPVQPKPETPKPVEQKIPVSPAPAVSKPEPVKAPESAPKTEEKKPVTIDPSKVVAPTDTKGQVVYEPKTPGEPKLEPNAQKGKGGNRKKKQKKKSRK